MITIIFRLRAKTLSIYFSTYTNRREVARFIDDEDTKSIDYTSHNQKRKTSGNSGEKEGRVLRECVVYANRKPLCFIPAKVRSGVLRSLILLEEKYRGRFYKNRERSGLGRAPVELSGGRAGRKRKWLDRARGKLERKCEKERKSDRTQR